MLSRMNFKGVVKTVKWSKDGKWIALGVDNQLQVWHSPSPNKEFAPFVLHRKYPPHYDTLLSLDWSIDSRYLVTASKDMTIRIHDVEKEEGFIPVTLSGHRDYIISVYFATDSTTVSILH